MTRTSKPTLVTVVAAIDHQTHRTMSWVHEPDAPIGSGPERLKAFLQMAAKEGRVTEAHWFVGGQVLAYCESECKAIIDEVVPTAKYV